MQGVVGAALNRRRELRVWCTASASHSSAEAASSVLSTSPKSWIPRVGRANSSTRHLGKDTRLSETKWGLFFDPESPARMNLHQLQRKPMFAPAAFAPNNQEVTMGDESSVRCRTWNGGMGQQMSRLLAQNKHMPSDFPKLKGLRSQKQTFVCSAVEWIFTSNTGLFWSIKWEFCSFPQQNLCQRKCLKVFRRGSCLFVSSYMFCWLEILVVGCGRTGSGIVASNWVVSFTICSMGEKSHFWPLLLFFSGKILIHFPVDFWRKRSDQHNLTHQSHFEQNTGVFSFWHQVCNKPVEWLWGIGSWWRQLWMEPTLWLSHRPRSRGRDPSVPAPPSPSAPNPRTGNRASGPSWLLWRSGSPIHQSHPGLWQELSSSCSSCVRQ